MSFIGQVPQLDKTILSNITVSATGTGSAINTTGFAALTIQIANTSSTSLWSGIIQIEGSNDNVNWFPLLVNKVNELSQLSQIDTVGQYQVKADTLYVRYNCLQILNTCSFNVTGNTNLASSAADKLSWAMDETNNTPLNIKLQAQNSGIKQDLSGAFILSDAPQPVTVNLTATQNTIVIDTQGYQTIHLTTNATLAATGGVTFSNDGITFTAGISTTVAGAFATALIASTNYVIPVQGRFAKIIATTGGQLTYYLRNIPPQVTGQNLAAIAGLIVNSTTAQLGINVVQVGGTAAVTGGLAGTLGVGGSTAVGVAPTSNPIIAGGIDPGGLGRRLFSDATGRLILNPYSLATSVPSSLAGVTLTTSAGGNIAPVTNSGFNNQVALSSQDTTTVDGQLQIEVLNLILQEMKIMNQQMYELPRIIAANMNGYANATPVLQPYLGDEPTQMRNDASLFINQQ